MPEPRPDLTTAVGAALDEQRAAAEAREAASPAGQAAAARAAELDRLLDYADKHPAWFGEQPAQFRAHLAAHAERRRLAESNGAGA